MHHVLEVRRCGHPRCAESRESAPHGAQDEEVLAWVCEYSALKNHINMMISHSGSKAQHKEDTRNHGLEDPYVHVVF